MIKNSIITMREQAKGAANPAACDVPFCIEKQDAEGGRNDHSCTLQKVQVTRRTSINSPSGAVHSVSVPRSRSRFDFNGQTGLWLSELTRGSGACCKV